MAKTLQFRRGTTSELSSITGAPGELFVDTTKDVVVVSDGVTAGGFPLQSELVSNVNIKTINGTSVLGSGDITISGGDYGDANVAAYLPTYTGNLVSLTGNVTTTANISGNFFIGNGSQLTGVTASADLSEITEDVLPMFSEVYDIGSADKRWYDVYVSNKVDINGAEISGSEAGVVVDALLVDKLLFTDNMITPDNSTALEYEGDKGVLIINGNLDVEGDWMQVPVVADTPEDPILTTGEAGMLRYNQDAAQFEGYTTEWATLGGGGGGGAIEEVGTCSLSSVGIGGGTGGSFNNFFGPRTGQCNTTGFSNNFIGLFAGCSNTTGFNNNFFGGVSGCINTTGSDNNFFGCATGRHNTSGRHNNFFGRASGNCNTEGNYNNFFGQYTGFFNTSGCYNNFFGRNAGLSNISGGGNNFFGLNTGRSNTFGYHNNFFGDSAGLCNTTGSYNNFFGASAGRSNTAGAFNNFFGLSAGRSNTSGCYNNFFGRNAGLSNISGGSNNFFGRSAGFLNTTGNHNNFIGSYTGFCNTTGSWNTFIGQYAGCGNTNGSYNNFFGQNTGRSNTSGNFNNFFGINAGLNNTSGSNNLFFGTSAGTTGFFPDGLANITTESNRIIMGNGSHTCAQIQIAWTTVSDARDKCIYGAINRGLGFLKNVNPVEFAFKDRVTGELRDPAGKRRYGFLAQDILALEGDNPVIVSTENPDQLQMTNDYLIPILVNAVKELAAQVEELKSKRD